MTVLRFPEDDLVSREFWVSVAVSGEPHSSVSDLIADAWESFVQLGVWQVYVPFDVEDLF